MSRHQKGCLHEQKAPDWTYFDIPEISTDAIVFAPLRVSSALVSSATACLVGAQILLPFPFFWVKIGTIVGTCICLSPTVESNQARANLHTYLAIWLEAFGIHSRRVHDIFHINAFRMLYNTLYLTSLFSDLLTTDVVVKTSSLTCQTRRAPDWGRTIWMAAPNIRPTCSISI